eukprot:992950-Pelagomonas_calceolata.AAC.4
MGEVSLLITKPFSHDARDSMPKTTQEHAVMYMNVHIQHSALQLLCCMQSAWQLPRGSHASCQRLPNHSPGLEPSRPCTRDTDFLQAQG